MLARTQQPILAGELKGALREIGCDTIRVSAYGSKTKIGPNLNMGDPEHPLAALSLWDIGVNLPAAEEGMIELWTRNRVIPAHVLQRRPKVDTFAMLHHVGQGYGTVRMQWGRSTDPCRMTLKIYPRLVHALKGN